MVTVIPTREKNLYIPKELYPLCLFCAKVTGNSMIDAAYTLLSTAIHRTFNFFEKCDNELWHRRCPLKNSEPRHPCTPKSPSNTDCQLILILNSPSPSTSGKMTADSTILDVESTDQHVQSELDPLLGKDLKVLTKEEARSARTQFLALCWALFIIGWCDGSTGPLLPRIQEFYDVRVGP